MADEVEEADVSKSEASEGFNLICSFPPLTCRIIAIRFSDTIQESGRARVAELVLSSATAGRRIRRAAVIHLLSSSTSINQEITKRMFPIHEPKFHLSCGVDGSARCVNVLANFHLSAL